MVDQPDMLAILLPVIVGGVIGVVGGIAGPPLSHWLSQRAAAKERKVQRLEDILSAIHEHDHWLEDMRLHRMFGDTPRPAGAPPLPRAQALCAVHLPELRKAVDALDSASIRYTLWMAEAAKRRVSGKFDEVLDGFDDAFRDYRKVQLQAVEAITSYGSTKLGL